MALDLIDLMRGVESDLAHVEAKRASRELPQRLWQTLSAFANSPGGGLIILGVDEDERFAITGVDSPGKLQADLASLCDTMEPPLRPTIGVHKVKGKHLIAAEIPELPHTDKPCFHKPAGLTNGAFRRVADGDRKLTTFEVQVMMAGRGQPRDDEQVVEEAVEADLDPELVSELLRRMREPAASHFQRLDDRQALQTLKVLRPIGKTLHPTLAGLLAVGKYPQQFFPSLRATMVVYPTPRLGEPGPHGERFLDDRAFDGPIPRMIGPILAALKTHMARRSVVRGAGRMERWDYPEVALREALVNALVHRNLSPLGRSTPVQIQVFPDRMTVLNPGGLHGAMSLDQLGETGVSAGRNQTLLKLLEDIAPPGERFAVCENRGSGIGAMLGALKQAGMQPPIFEDRVAIFSVTFMNGQVLAQNDKPTLEQRLDRRRAILAALNEGPRSVTQLAATLALSPGTVRHWLRRMRKEKTVEATEEHTRSPYVRYRRR